MVAASKLEGTVGDVDIERSVGVVAGADADGSVVDEMAVDERDDAIHRGEERLTATEGAVGQKDVATIAMDVEAVDVAAVEEGLAEVVGAEHAPVAMGFYHLKRRVIDVIHREGVAIVAGGAITGIGALDGVAAETEVSAVADGEDPVGNHTAAGGGYADISNPDIALPDEGETVGAEGGAFDTVECEILNEGGTVGVEIVVVGFEASGIGVPRGYGSVSGNAVVEDEDVAAVLLVAVAAAFGPRGEVFEDEEMLASGELGDRAEVKGVDERLVESDGMGSGDAREEGAMGGVVGDVEDEAAEVGVGAERDGFEIGRKLKLKRVDTVVGDCKAASEGVGMGAVESVVAVDAVGGLAKTIVEWRDLGMG